MKSHIKSEVSLMTKIDQGDAEAAANRAAQGKPNEWRRRVTGAPKKPGDQCAILHLATGLNQPPFTRLARQIVVFWKWKNRRREEPYPIHATRDHVLMFFALINGSDLRNCLPEARQFGDALGTVTGEDGNAFAQVINLLYDPAARAAAAALANSGLDESGGNAPLVLDPFTAGLVTIGDAPPVATPVMVGGSS